MLAARDRQLDRRRHVPARAAQDARAPRGHAHDRIVGARLDRTIVEQEEIGDARQALASFVVAIGDRLVGHVAARHHERLGGVRRQQMVQRRVGQHHAELGRRRSDRARHGRVRAPPGQHDRPLAREQKLPLGRGQIHELARRGQVRRHHRKRLVLAVLARAQLRHRGLVGGATGQMEPAEALYGDDRPAEQRTRGGLDGVARARVGQLAAAGVGEPHPRPTLGARVGLSVEAPVRRVLVLRAAGGAHLEAGHRRMRAVVGDVAHDREARAAVRAVGERVAKAPVGRIEQLGQAVGTGRAVGADRGARLAARRALADREAALAELLDLLGDDPLDRRERWRLDRKPREEALHRLGRRLDLDHHAARVVQDVAGDTELAGEPVDVGAKSDPLNGSLDPRPDPAHAGASRGRARVSLSTSP